ncbi:MULTISPECIES: hypothetical protein [unclassified Streptomyces]|uniref:hypothetical protein n=1 Tax=unclassified Streptomyces TaxID=2593676 RepID=UPI0022B6A940|nr:MULTISPECIES: hypothetical protein [unclassified Streptomyces]MCZ7417311.1 hypothetical protein [Streptomyces sp. WMMC897]MCZ7432862.1 hypothetical protein [Streptomyces sp. WMMC1477]
MIYLRCYPFDPMGMECHVRALEEVSAGMGVPQPMLIMDNGRRSSDGLPGRDLLLRLAGHGLLDAVLVPGPFVFSLDGAQAAAVVAELEARGCRVMELPGGGGGRAPVRARAAWQRAA